MDAADKENIKLTTFDYTDESTNHSAKKKEAGNSSDNKPFQTEPLINAEGNVTPTPFLSSTRLRLSLVCFFGFACLYAQRVNLSIAMVCMVKSPYYNTSIGFNTTSNQTKVSNSECEELEHKHDDSGEFEWDKVLQGNILASFFYGYLVLQIPAGLISEKLGAKHVVTAGMLPVAILTLLTPICTRVSPVFLIVVRVLIGMGEAVLYPANAALWGVWSPPSERSKLVGLALSGGQFGNAVVLPVGGLLCSAAGWDSIFYVIGALGTAFCLLWIFWVSDHPHKHKLKKAERVYLDAVIQGAEGKPAATPWKGIFTSLPFWAILVAHTTGNYAYYMNLTQIPTYMKDVLKFDIKTNGLLSMLPYLAFWACCVVGGILSDWLLTRGVGILVVRKVFAALGLIIPAVFLIATSFVDCTRSYVAIITLCLAVGGTGLAFCSYLVNHGDLAPKYAGTMFGITNTAATIPGIVAPSIVGQLTKGGTVAEWQIAFAIAAAINVFGAIFYVIFAKAEIQPWSGDTPESAAKRPAAFH